MPPEDLVIYELHVRGFTRHPASGVRHPGTFAGLVEKVPYLCDLGVNCVELMPVFEFDELDVPRQNPVTGDRLHNYWGYSTVAFFAPKSAYAATGAHGMRSRLYSVASDSLARARTGRRALGRQQGSGPLRGTCRASGLLEETGSTPHPI